MRLHERRNELEQLTREIQADIDELIAHISRKISRPYGDGTTSNLVNVNSDVLPRLRSIRIRLADATQEAQS